MKQIGIFTRPTFLLGFLLVGLLCASLTLVSVARADEPASGTDATAAGASDGSGATPAKTAEQVKEETVAADEAKEEPAKAWADMSTDEKLESLKSATLTVGDDGKVKSDVYTDSDVLWTCLAAFLVFFMQAGFALVECGFTRAKNACNIIMKNVMDFSLGSLTFWLIGFGLMFGVTSGFCGTSAFFFDGGDNSFNWAFLIFQTVFCATAATIVSGAMAERTKFVSYLIYTVVITVIVYPIFGSWAWGGLYDGGGWLEASGGVLPKLFGVEELGFIDFAGSTVVHSIGGWCALAGAIVLGARIGKFGKDGRVNPIPGHNIPLAALGVFILWLGWFGFNPGSTTAVRGGSFAEIAVTTNLSAAAGAVGAMIASWLMFKKPDPSFTLNGALAGLVAITAGCANLSPLFSAVTGLVAGGLVVFSVVAFDRLRIDDPVGAVSVHGVCGAWGTLAVGLFIPETGLLMGGGAAQFLVQLIGVLAAFAWAFPVSMAVFLGLKYTLGLRVSEEEEMEGLDIAEHGMHAYPPNLIAEGTQGMSPAIPAMAHSAAPAPVPSAEGV